MELPADWVFVYHFRCPICTQPLEKRDERAPWICTCGFREDYGRAWTRAEPRPVRED